MTNPVPKSIENALTALERHIQRVKRMRDESAKNLKMLDQELEKCLKEHESLKAVRDKLHAQRRPQ